MMDYIGLGKETLATVGKGYVDLHIEQFGVVSDGRLRVLTRFMIGEQKDAGTTSMHEYPIDQGLEKLMEALEGERKRLVADFKSVQENITRYLNYKTGGRIDEELYGGLVEAAFVTYAGEHARALFGKCKTPGGAVSEGAFPVLGTHAQYTSIRNALFGADLKKEEAKIFWPDPFEGRIVRLSEMLADAQYCLHDILGNDSGEEWKGYTTTGESIARQFTKFAQAMETFMDTADRFWASNTVNPEDKKEALRTALGGRAQEARAAYDEFLGIASEHHMLDALGDITRMIDPPTNRNTGMIPLMAELANSAAVEHRLRGMIAPGGGKGLGR